MKFDLSPQSFESLVQALAGKIFGPNLVVFGPGPDGAREATFEGVTPLMSPNGKIWKGYVVIQAKCRESLKNDHRDADWLCQQLRGEFAKFTNKGSKLRKPDYYVIVSNVQLSAVPSTGGKAKVEKVVKQGKRALGLKDYCIWSADELRTLLQNAEDIRRSYAAWITPSDVLASLIESLELPSFSSVFQVSLSRDLRTERDVRLRDAGHETDHPVFLEDVFFDLPIKLPGAAAIQRQEEGTLESDPSKTVELSNYRLQTTDNNERIFAVHELLQRVADKFDTSVVTGANEQKVPLSNRVVLLGGPGQGKSTMGQFLAQVTRARALNTIIYDLPLPVRDAVTHILNRVQGLNLPVNGPIRFPVRIELPMFADELASGTQQDNANTLLAYIAKRLSNNTAEQIRVPFLRKWLAACPWLIILDGLDEVPPSANRANVIAAIESLWDDVYRAKADVLVVVTTRPQGYHHDLDPKYWEHWTLIQLEAKEALSYASKLAKARLSDESRQKSIVQELGRACADPATRLLATTPLQVTILFGIAFLKGTIPQARWDLFDRYYALLRDREAQKPGPSAAIFRDYKRHVDAVHHTCGFLLQVMAEQAGRSVSFLTRDQLLLIISGLLTAEGYNQDQASDVAVKLANAATDRLVLLSARTENQISFDVRSLQEYMAAAKITASSDVPFGTRMRGIALSAHWRHVFRIAASKIFSVAEMSNLRAEVTSICSALDSGEIELAPVMARVGSSLALDLLADGIAASAPNFQRALTTLAFSCLDFGRQADSRLITNFSSALADVYKSQIVQRLHLSQSEQAKSAWRLLFDLMVVDQEWAEQIVIDEWPADSAFALEIASNSDSRHWTRRVTELIRKAEMGAGFSSALRFNLNLRVGRGERVKSSKSFRSSLIPPGVITDLPDDRIVLFPGQYNVSDFVEITPLRSCSRYISRKSSESSPGWEFLAALQSFARSPSKATLSEIFISLDQYQSKDANLVPRFQYPWPLDSTWQDAVEGRSLSEISRLVTDGAFGDTREWYHAELRWNQKGISREDLFSWNDGFYLTRNIANVGAPAFNRRFRFGNFGQEQVAVFLELIRNIEPFRKRLRLFSFIVNRSSEKPIPELGPVVSQLIESARISGCEAELAHQVLMCLPGLPAMQGLFEFLDRVGRTGGLRSSSPPLSLATIVKAFNTCPSHRGLLDLAVHGLLSSRVEAPLRALHISAFEAQDGDSESIRRAVAILRILSGAWRPQEVEKLAADILYAPNDLIVYRVGEVIRRSSSESNTNKQGLLLSLLSKMQQNNIYARQQLLELLKSEVEATPTALWEEKVCKRLNVPCISRWGVV